jgi:NDP-sugar pyrophosphorylase family protein
MNHPIHLLIPMSGQGTRYQAAGYTEPKPLIPVSGIPMIERVLSAFPAHWPTHFIMAENHNSTSLPALLKTLRPEGTQQAIPRHTLGPGHAIASGVKLVPENHAVLVSYCDYGMSWDAHQFETFVRDSDCDACVISYRGFHPHYLSPTKYAYSRLVGENVVEVREKGSFTENRENEFASTGGYYFKTAELLSQALEFQQKHKLEMNGELYTSLTVEALLQMKPDARVRVFEIQRFFQWGTPEDLKTFEYWERTFQSYNQLPRERPTVDQVLMPMAGFGSRFSHITDLPKPLIPVGDQPMFEAALLSLPEAKKTVVVTLKEVAEQLRSKKMDIVSLESTPSGQALSTEAGVSSLDFKKEVLVSACDHGIVLSPHIWNTFHQSPDCDAAIFSMQGFLGADKKPNAYAYIVPESSPSLGDPTPLVKSVSVKKPVSSVPSNDHVLVGTFWFRSAEILQKGIDELKLRDVRVNGELYLDSVFECLMSMGHRVRIIPLDAYIGWGDPDLLSESIYWQEVFCGKAFSGRDRFPNVPKRKMK